MTVGVDRGLLRAWLDGRSIARGVPPPVPDRGGFRVDTGSDAEICRWVFAHAGADIADLARDVGQPGHVLKLCDTAETLARLVPACWTVRPTGWFMIGAGDWPERRCPAGYAVETICDGARCHVRILAPDGDVAASGWTAETGNGFIYDRIVTDVHHRRRGLGGATMSALRASRRNREAPDLLVATPDGRALYETLGWRVLSPYATATIERD